jgi:hypothetical protein
MAPQRNEVLQFTREVEGWILVWPDHVEYLEGETGFTVQRPFLTQEPVAMGSLAQLEAVPVQSPLYVRAASHERAAGDQVSDRVDASSRYRLKVLLLHGSSVCHLQASA